MGRWNFFLLQLVSFLVIVPIGGFALMKTVDSIKKLLATGKERNKWIAMSIIVAIYLILSGWFA